MSDRKPTHLYHLDHPSNLQCIPTMSLDLNIDVDHFSKLKHQISGLTLDAVMRCERSTMIEEPSMKWWVGGHEWECPHCGGQGG